RDASSNALVYPALHFFRQPCHPASAKPYPRGELAGDFKTGDMLKAVRNTIYGFQIFLAHRFLCHRTLPSKREHRDARQEPASGRENSIGYGLTRGKRDGPPILRSLHASPADTRTGYKSPPPRKSLGPARCQ